MNYVFNNWKTYMFMDEESLEYCGKHQVKLVKILSKLNEKQIGKGFVCPTCEITLMNFGNDIIVRKNEKWLPMKEYANQQVVKL
jgi:hypothetical protein